MKNAAQYKIFLLEEVQIFIYFFAILVVVFFIYIF